jgi:hypothetical protein
VFYAHHAGSLEVIALNARDGSTAWSAPASPSELTAGEAVELAVRAGTVFYLQGVKGQSATGAAQVVARSGASGAVLWRSAVGFFATIPEICPDQSAAICINGSVPKVGWGELRLSAARGRLLSLVRMGTAAFPGRELGPDLFDPGSRHPEQLLAVRGGRIAWRRPLAAIFTLSHASSDGGWNFDRFGKLGLFVGSVETTPRFAGGRYYKNLRPSMTVGVTLGAGRLAWGTRGLYFCGPLPCPGRTEAGYSSPATSSPASIGLRLLRTGTATGSVNGGTPKISSNASVTIQGFKPATGTTEWSFNAGRDLALLSGQAAQPLVGPTSIILKHGSRRIALDLRNGKTRRVRAGTRAWCQRPILYQLAHAAYYHGGRGLYVGQDALYPCTATGRRLALPAKIPSLLGRIGATTEGITAWTDTQTVHAEPNRP